MQIYLKTKKKSKPSLQQQEPSTPSLAPVLNHVKKTLVRKLGGDTTSSNENLEDSMRKVNKYVRTRKQGIVFILLSIHIY